MDLVLRTEQLRWGKTQTSVEVSAVITGQERKLDPKIMTQMELSNMCGT